MAGFFYAPARSDRFVRFAVDYEAQATDNCLNGVVVEYDPPSGSLFKEGTHVVQCTAIDGAGNRSLCYFRVIVSCERECSRRVAGVIPGDWNADGRVNLADSIILLNNLFQARSSGLPCEEDDIEAPGNQTSFDFNGDNRVNLADAIGTLNRLFLSGAPHVLGDESDCVFIAGCAGACESRIPCNSRRQR